MNTIFGGQPYNQNPNNRGGFSDFVSNFMQRFPNMNPQQVGMDLLNSGKMSPADFQRFSAIANRLTGRTGN